MAEFGYGRSSSPLKMRAERPFMDSNLSVKYSASTPAVRAASPVGRGLYGATSGATSRASNVSSAGSESMQGLMSEFRELYKSRMEKLEVEDDGHEESAKVTTNVFLNIILH